ncbi:hypothetical protein E3P81_02721 [Wallemia ichthyophaga]|nr:hypothetical protein E3P98_02406 [Wallemia ichthyophaga]TIA89972.1 hypothetical protein E3P97_02792 [Wallemia ichthyophaga]TIB31132.1 hypothetical protein E3P85_02392 [Wallemia ichthyophaga]TIB45635.1 hypothetical protein E3P82_02667 [Wallemia ichthyophaga]TIB48968.1 hypothetical protein E3P81_02721 [Wallemia ichthyophaga]
MPSIRLRENNEIEILSHGNSANKIQSTSAQQVCGICSLNLSVYICPSCNVPYCSLSCYKSDKHGQCSDRFVTQQLKETEDSPIDHSQRHQFLNLLKNHYNQTSEDHLNFLKDEDSDDDDDTLIQRLSSIDLDNSTHDDILNILTQAEKDRFHELFLPSNRSHLTQLLQNQLQPWFDQFDPTSFVNPFNLTSIPVFEGGQLLSSNLAAIIFAYAFILRRYSFNLLSSFDNISTDVSDAKKDFPNSKFVYNNPSEAVQSIWSSLPSHLRSQQLYITLLHDIKLLLSPPQIIRQDDTLLCCVCLFDLIQVFGQSKTSSVAKLRFYMTRSHHMTNSLKDKVGFIDKAIAESSHL